MAFVASQVQNHDLLNSTANKRSKHWATRLFYFKTETEKWSTYLSVRPDSVINWYNNKNSTHLSAFHHLNCRTWKLVVNDDHISGIAVQGDDVIRIHRSSHHAIVGWFVFRSEAVLCVLQNRVVKYHVIKLTGSRRSVSQTHHSPHRKLIWALITGTYVIDGGLQKTREHSQYQENRPLSGCHFLRKNIWDIAGWCKELAHTKQVGLSDLIYQGHLINDRNLDSISPTPVRRKHLYNICTMLDQRQRSSSRSSKLHLLVRKALLLNIKCQPCISSSIPLLPTLWSPFWFIMVRPTHLLTMSLSTVRIEDFPSLTCLSSWLPCT